MTSVVWFRRNLRWSDNRVLYHALKESDDVVLFFQLNPEQFIVGSPSHHSFFASVAQFKKEIDQFAHLQVHFGSPLDSFKQLKKCLPEFSHVYFQTEDTGFGAVRDQEMRLFFKKENIAIHDYQDHYLHDVDKIKNNSGEHYKVFTPYYKKWQSLRKEKPVNMPSFSSGTIEKRVFFPEEERHFETFTQKIPSVYFNRTGEKVALQRLKEFIQVDLENYDFVRDFPFLNQTSRLSSFLRTGELSIRTVWDELQKQPFSKGRETFEKELCWRDFYHMIYAAYPNQKNEAIIENYRFIEWENQPDHFKKWQEGNTGYPIVDAAMRQLKETGWMHNRLRMIVASFLTKDLLIDWRWGEKYFQQMLIDYDAASNIGGWQWAASTGTDAVPYFRIFNPTTQSERFDKQGAFIRQYVPELRNVPQTLIHQPEKMTVAQQKEYGISIGKEYPYPIVNHQERRKLALAKYEFSREWYQERKTQNG